MRTYQFPNVCVTMGRFWTRCVTTDFAVSWRLWGRTSEIPICDTHPGGIQIQCIRVTRAQKYSVSARGHTRNKRGSEKLEVAA